MTTSAVILAGGKATRMQGQDKGLQCLAGKPLFMHVYERLRPHISTISINANRNLEQYAQSGLPVFSDNPYEFLGPLGGILTALHRTKSDFVLFVPCDCPFFPENLVEKLKRAVEKDDVLIAYAGDPVNVHPTFCLLSKNMIEPLHAYLQQGGRKLLQFMHQHHARAVFFPNPADFLNINTLDALKEAEKRFTVF